MKSKVAAAVAVAFAASCVSGCSSVIEGTSQEILVNTNPVGANCEFVREGNVIARVTQTPGGATIKKTKHDITLKCNKQGFQEATYLNHSGAAGATFGNIILGGGIGWAIDSASGADNKYDGVVNMTLVPASAETAAAAPVPATVTGAASAPAPTLIATTPASNGPCTHDQEVRARIAKTNSYTSGPKCD
jgi:hypothetical protein